MYNLHLPGLGGSSSTDFSGYFGMGGSSPQSTQMIGGGMDVMGTHRKFSGFGGGFNGSMNMNNPMSGGGFGSFGGMGMYG